MGKTISDLKVIKDAQEVVRRDLGPRYEEIVTPYVTIIEMVMRANAINEFEAMLKIKNTLPLYNKPDAPLLFSAALMDIVEAKHFKAFRS